MKCDKCGYDDNGTGDTAHLCGWTSRTPAPVVMTKHESVLTDDERRDTIDAADQMYCERDGDRDAFIASAIEQAVLAKQAAQEWENAKFVQRVLEAVPVATDKDRADALGMVKEFRKQVWEASRAKQAAQVEELKTRLEAADALTNRVLNSRVPVEQELFDMAAGKKPMPDASKLRELATRLGDPTRRPATEAQVEPQALTTNTLVNQNAASLSDKRTEAQAEPVCETGLPSRKMHRWFKRVPIGTLLYTTPPASSALVEAAEKAYEALQNSQQYVEASANKKLLGGWGEQLDEAESASIALRAAIEAEKKGQEHD